MFDQSKKYLDLNASSNFASSFHVNSKSLHKQNQSYDSSKQSSFKLVPQCIEINGMLSPTNPLITQSPTVCMTSSNVSPQKKKKVASPNKENVYENIQPKRIASPKKENVYENIQSKRRGRGARSSHRSMGKNIKVQQSQPVVPRLKLGSISSPKKSRSPNKKPIIQTKPKPKFDAALT